jgi:hypothetical protein
MSNGSLSTIQALIRRLTDSSACAASEMRHSAVHLSALQHPRRALLDYLAQLSPEQHDSLFDGSHDTPTHFKWLVYRNQRPRFTLWLHEYKASQLRGPGYAQVPHDHRYDIASLILTGGYIAATWQITQGKLTPADIKSYRPFDVMRLGHTEIHSLVEIEPETLTLVVEGPRIKAFSTAYYPPAEEPFTFPDFPARWPALRTKLAG